MLVSASPDLVGLASESLAGRVELVELGGLRVSNVGTDKIDRLWLHGGLPRSFIASATDSWIWRQNYVATFLERDLPRIGIRIPAAQLRRFWTMLAHRQSGLLNAAELARSLGVDAKTVAGYLDLLVDLLLVRRLEPWHSNAGKRLVKSPRIYVRDSGLVHTLLGLTTSEDILGHPIAGPSWEGLVVETLIAAAPEGTRPNFYPTSADAPRAPCLRRRIECGPSNVPVILWTILARERVGRKDERMLQQGI